jgi:hypothetical protein
MSVVFYYFPCHSLDVKAALNFFTLTVGQIHSSFFKDEEMKCIPFQVYLRKEWTEIASVYHIDIIYAMPYALLTDPTDPGHVYTSLSNGEVLHSTDHGDTWHRLPVHFE